jgi:hypothetical protein
MAFMWLKYLLRPILKKYASPELSTSDNSDDLEFSGNDKILDITVKAVWIKHGGLAGLGSIFTYPTVGQIIKHHWIEIRTNNGLYSVQFHGGANSLFIHKKNSIEDIIKEAKRAAGMNECEDKEIYCVYPAKSIKENKNMEDIKLFVKSYAEIGRYNLVLNNCQDFSAALYKWLE